MKKLQLLVLSVIIPISLAVYANDMPKLGAPTPLQSFESAGSASSKVQSSQGMPSTKKPGLEFNANAKVSKELKSQINTLSQATLRFQEETNQKIENLSTQNKDVQTKLQKLTTAMVMMNQELSSFERSHSVSSHVSKPKSHAFSFSSLLKYFAFGLVALLAILLGVLIARQKKQAA